MPLRKHGTILKTALVATTLVAAAPASASAGSWSLQSFLGTTATSTTSTVTNTVDTVAAPTSCPAQSTTNAFAAFGDDADYALAPQGDFEGGASGWKLSGMASVVSGNDDTGVSDGSRSLQMFGGSKAVSPEFCVSEANPYFRFMTKPQFFYSTYTALVLYRNSSGQLTSRQFVSSAGTEIFPGQWRPSAISPLATKIPLAGQTATVQIVIQAGQGITSFDSLMVDPYRRG